MRRLAYLSRAWNADAIPHSPLPIPVFMTVYPFVIHLGKFSITGYGIMLMAAFLVAGWVFARELERSGREPTIAWDCVVFAVIGGLLGGKVYYAILTHDSSALFS